MSNPIYRGEHITPINSTAMRVLCAEGTKFQSLRKPNQLHWESPPPIQKLSCGQKDLTGANFGRFTVVGKYGSKKNRGTLWLVRCSCGDYETRTTKAVLNPKNNQDCCEFCLELVLIKKREARKNKVS